MSSVRVRLPLPGPLVKRLRHRPFTAVIWVRFPYGSPSHRNTLDQSRENLDVPKCFGLSGVKNFLKTPWLNGDVTEAQTGFEPLFFHIQADFQWQRPFSEGRDDRFSEKTKKNLSQNYGRWIIGFDGPMTSAFFALKKGAEIGGIE